MVEKIDRPEAPHPYRVGRAKESRENLPQQQQQREEQEKRYKKKLETAEWGKFGTRTVVIKPVRVPRESIQRCLFRAVSLHSGVGILQADITWQDGRTIRRVLILLRALEDFMRLKKFSPGEQVPENIWARGPTVEIGIPQVISRAGTPPSPRAEEREEGQAREKAQKAISGPLSWLSYIGLIDRATGGINWGIVALYLFLAAIAVALIIL